MDYANTSGIKSPFSPRVRQSIQGRRPGLGSAKNNSSKYKQSNDSQAGEVVYKTPFCTVETYGMPLPVMVTEALTFASSSVSVRLSATGWCWLVTGRRVLCWSREQGSASVAARELTLPQTDLAHKADLVVLFYEDGAQMPSCIGVSPEGTVRYWPSIGQEGVYVDVSAELAGQECDRLTEPMEAGLVLATTTCTVVLLKQGIVDGRACVSTRTLRPPHGWLGGLGRRVSVLFFGSMPAHADTKLVNVVVLSDGPILSPGAGFSQAGCVALVSSGGLLQLWREQLHEHDLRDQLHAPPQGEPHTMELSVLDAVYRAENTLMLLVAAGNAARADLRYALATISVEDPAKPRVTSLVSLRSWGWGWGGERLLPLAGRHVLVSRDYIAHVNSTVPNEAPDVIDVSASGDRVLGAAPCPGGGGALLFSCKHGVTLLRVTHRGQDHNKSLCDSPMGSPCPSDVYDGNLSLYEIDPHEVSTTTTDACGKLKTAFLFHLRRQPARAAALLEELFPLAGGAGGAGAGPGAGGDVDAPLDRTVMRIATEMLDDMPAGDPRWKQRLSNVHTSIPLGSSAALQIGSQLRDKQRAFSLFVDFLVVTGLCQRLGRVSTESGVGSVPTVSALVSLAERLAAAAALRQLHTQGHHTALIDSAVHQVASHPDYDEDPEVSSALSSGALSAADVCYRRVSQIESVLRAVAQAGGVAPLTTVLSEMHKCRASWQARFGGAVSAGEGARALLTSLHDLVRRAVLEYAAACPDATQRAALYEGAARLAALLLSDAALLPPHQYEKMRHDTIQPFITANQTERALALAERFRDFELLISICVRADHIDKLCEYIDKYASEGLPEVAFSWLAGHGGGARAALVRQLGARYPQRLAAWLRAAEHRRGLGALHELQAREYVSAAETLLQMAEQERDSVCRMATMSSLAKLCLCAAPSPPEGTWRRAEARLELAEQHRALPRDVRVQHGMDAPDTRVHDAEELLQMYIESESGSLTEYDYKKALDLTDFIQDMERRDELRLQVWCACLLRDPRLRDVTAAGCDDARSELQQLMFFRLVDLVQVMGGDLELLLPPVEDVLTAPQLAELVSSPSAEYLIKYGYECLDTGARDTQASVSMEA